MKRFSSTLGLAALAMVGCGSSFDPGGAGSGGAGSITITSGSSGGGGLIIGEAPPACDDPTVFLEVSGDLSLSADSSCLPTGQIDTSPSPDVLSIGARCEGEGGFGIDAPSDGQIWPGASSEASVWLVYGGGAYAQAPAKSGTLEVTTFEAPGGVVEGSFSAALEATKPGSGPPTIKIHGSFRVCREYDRWLD